MSKDVTKASGNQQIQSAILEVAQRSDIDPERLEKFLDLQVKLEARQNEQAFNDAFACFQEECPIIQKTKKVSYNQTNYDYATLDEMVHQIKPILGKHGLGYSFDTRKEGDEMVLITTITHKAGHEKSFNYYFNAMDSGGKMNDSQRRKSALTYAKRSALENALGIVTAGEDDDARRAIENPATEKQLKEIKSLMKVTDTTEEKLFSFYKLESFEFLNTVEAKRIINGLTTKRQVMIENQKEGK